MKTIHLLRSAAALAVGALSLAATSAAESIEASVRNIFKATDAGDRAAALAYAPSPDTKFPVVVFDYDWDNKPVAIEGVDGVNKYLNSLFDEMGKRKLKIASTVSNVRSDSRSPGLGCAIFDLTQTITADGKSETVRFRVTMLGSFDQKLNKWRMVHWHATLVTADAPPGK